MYKEYGWQRLTPTRRAKLAEYLTAEVDIYSQYLNGEVYGYTVRDSNGEILDSLWGIYGINEAESMAKEAADGFAIERDKEQAQIEARLEAVSA